MTVLCLNSFCSTLQLGGTLQLGRPSLSDCSCQIFILYVTTA